MSIPVVSARKHGQIVLHFDRNGPVPTVPYELHDYIAAEAWASRIPQLIRLSNRYNRPVLEGLWFIVGFIMTIAIPATLHEVIRRSFGKTMNRDDARAQARFISFSIAIAISLLFTAPHVIWKYMGQKRATELVKRWEAEDARGRPPGSFVPVWTVKLSGYLSSHTRLIITTLATASPTVFHPAAYMPAWINGPADSGPHNGVPASYQGYQHPATYGDIPLYGVPSGPLPPYISDDQRPYSNEKVGF